MKKHYQRWLALAVVMIGLLKLPVGAVVMPGEVALGGMPFGVKFYAEGIVIVGFSEVETAEGRANPAYDAGLRVNDVITRVDGKEVETAEEVLERIESESDGGKIEITYRRDGAERSTTVTPAQSAKDGKRRTGMWIRDTMAGIGTVTYLLEDSGDFAGLGHGICDAETGELIPMEHGSVVDVEITGIVRGQPGVPGELKGYFTGETSGVLLGNTACGVFGVFTSSDPENCVSVAVGCRDDVHEGRASILCTLAGHEPEEYEICITDIDRKSRDNRSFSIIVTDKKLLARTGGIVQGMSGSPILQDGKLVGAVTHVLVNDPSEGYGIFIENMMENMEAVLRG